jgi:ubiquinone/menaquinone biosynthesis C-methylase UbiE
MNQEKKNEAIKESVKEKYSEIAQQSKTSNESSCCGATSSCGEPDYTIFSDDYSDQEGYVEEADLGLGCGIPTEGATVREGDTVLDLGSGAGNDCFVARRMTGAKGRVIGIDFSEEMVAKAKSNAEMMGYGSVEFHVGDIESMPLEKNSVDVILSNCVLNLVPDKQKAFKEMFRVLKPGAHFSISDVVIQGELPEGLKEDAAMYAGCVSGALQEEAYLGGIEKAGFCRVEVVKRKAIELPEEILSQYLGESEMERFRSGEVGIHSITVRGVKSTVEGMACCT